MLTWIARLSDLLAAKAGKSGWADAGIALFSVRLLADTAVFARIEGARLASCDAAAASCVSHQFVGCGVHH